MSRTILAAAALALALAVPLAAFGEPPQSPKPLTEADVLKLIELQMDDGCIIARLQRGGGPAFVLDGAVEKRLRGAGASDDVIAALKRRPDEKPDLPDDPARETIAVWATQSYARDCPLVSELRVNGTLVDEFSSTAKRGLGKHLKMGWNTLTMRTRVRDDLKEMNHLVFEIGPTRKDPRTGKEVMEPVLWGFNNRTDWETKDGAIRHRLGPDVKEVTLTFRLYFAGLKYESAAVKAGDFVLRHNQSYSDTPPVTTTLFVNGTPLNTFLGEVRKESVVTPLLKKGRNEVRVVTCRIPNALYANRVGFDLDGPAEYNATLRRFEFKPVVNFRSTDGWVQDKKSGQWRVEAKPDAGEWERPPVTFQLDEAPGRK